MAPVQGFITSYAPRLRTHVNSFLAPVVQPSTAQAAPASRTTKRGTVVINYSEDLLGDDDFDDSDGPRRPTGLRSRREDPNQGREGVLDRIGKELNAPVDVQGIWRDWMGKPKFGKTDKQLHAQASLPFTPVPIRIDLDIPSYTPQPALPLPTVQAGFPINPGLPAYRTPEPTLPVRLKDVFIWNLYETLITPDHFALVLAHELDLPNASAYAIQISAQIRKQLEEHAGVALHPLFFTANTAQGNGTAADIVQNGSSREHSGTPADVGTPIQSVPSNETTKNRAAQQPAITATASAYHDSATDEYSPDDTYRCLIDLKINLLNKLYTDKFEWSLLHPPGFAEYFAKQTCADIGLAGEWIPTMAHAIYEAVLKLKKEACESGGLLGADGYGGINNDSLDGQEAGWRFDHERLADEWEPKVEILSKEEIEKREGDHERRIRRMRRENARFSTTANMSGGLSTSGGLYDQPENADTPMGRGERSKKKRRFRSLSPLARGNTPGVSLEVAGLGGTLNDWERQSWRCSHCMIHGTAVWGVRDGPSGPKSLCNNCGFLYERGKKLPLWAKDLHKLDAPLGVR